MKNQIWILSILPKWAKCIGVKWIYKSNLNKNGEESKYKARLIAKQYSQELEIDCDEVYKYVARMDTIIPVFATFAQKSRDIYELDVNEHVSIE